MRDYHVHTAFSSDCRTPMAQMVTTGIKKGLQEICFTDHVDEDTGNLRTTTCIDFNVWDQTFHNLNQLYGEQIILKKGVELGIQPHILESSKSLVLKNNFDFVIMSMHTCQKRDLYDQSFFAGKTIEEAWLIYLDELTHCAQAFDNYSVLGHVSLLKRYNEAANQYDEHALKTAYQQLFEVLIAKGKGLEVNTSTLRNPNIKDSQPSPLLLKWFRELGGQIVTFGSDSHHTQHLGSGFDYMVNTLLDLGYQHFYSFEKMQPIAHRLIDYK